MNAYSGSVSPQVLQAVQARLENTKTVLESADEAQIGALTRQELLGDLFHAGGLGYYAQLGALSYLMGLQAGGHHLLSAGTGTFGYEPNVDYFFGFPQAIRTGGVVFDIPLLNVFAVDDGDADRRRQFALQTGILSSALEHAVPDQMFVNAENPGEAISAVKALQKASSAGQRIYHVTRDNQASVLAAIHHDAETMNEIRNALNVGKEVITHTDAVSVPGWSGVGYIIVDPETGDGAYKISGGNNGAFIKLIINELDKELIVDGFLYAFSALISFSETYADQYIWRIMKDFLPPSYSPKLLNLYEWSGIAQTLTAFLSVYLVGDIVLNDDLTTLNKIGQIITTTAGLILSVAIGSLLVGSSLGAIAAATIAALSGFAISLLVDKINALYFSFRLFFRKYNKYFLKFT